MWAAPRGKGFIWHSSRVDGSKNELVLGPASADLGLVAIRPAGGGHPRGKGHDGFIVLSTRTGPKSTVEAMLLGQAGQLTAGPIALTEHAERVLWVDAARTPKGTLAFWAVDDHGRATIYLALIRPDGRVEKEPRVAVTDALSWQIAGAPDKAMLGVVVAGKPSSGSGSVRVFCFDASGGSVGKPITVSEQPTAQTDLDMAWVGNSVVLAWSDRREPDARVLVAVVDTVGKILRAPSPASTPKGEEALVRLVPPWQPGGLAYLVWENLSEGVARGRRLLIKSVNAKGDMGPDVGVLEVASDDDTIAEFAATRRGLAALTLGPECPRRGPCKAEDLVPMFVELGAHFEPLAVEPLRLRALEGKAAALAWGLACTEQSCLALATKATAPTPAFAVRLESRSSYWWSPAGPRRLAPPPRMAALRTVFHGDELADVSALPGEQGALVATVTYFDPNARPRKLTKPAADGRYEPLSALLETRLVSAGSASPEPKTISLRARSLGGVDLAAGDPPDTLLIWSALDLDVPQVFLTLLDASGARVRQRMLTHSHGEIWDVATARVEGGWLVGWISERDGDPEVYVTKVDRKLKRLCPEQRVTRASGAATGLRLLGSKDSVLAVWSDTRGDGSTGADIYSARINVADASLIGSEKRFSETPWHSHSPAVARARDGAVVAWLESPLSPDAEPGPGLGARVIEVRADGSISPGVLLESDRFLPSGGLTLACADAHCRGVFAARTGTTGEMRGFVWKPEDMAPAKTTRLGGLWGPSESTAATVVDSTVFFTDIAEKRGRLEQMTVDWE